MWLNLQQRYRSFSSWKRTCIVADLNMWWRWPTTCISTALFLHTHFVISSSKVGRSEDIYTNYCFICLHEENVSRYFLSKILTSTYVETKTNPWNSEILVLRKRSRIHDVSLFFFFQRYWHFLQPMLIAFADVKCIFFSFPKNCFSAQVVHYILIWESVLLTFS